MKATAINITQKTVTMNADSPIKGKKLLWLGSSVFQGFGSGKTSPALFIDALDGTISTIEVKGGTSSSIDSSIGGECRWFHFGGSSVLISTVCVTILPRPTRTMTW